MRRRGWGAPRARTCPEVAELAGEEGVISTDPYRMSLIERFRSASRETFWRRLLAWVVITAAAAVALRLFVEPGSNVPSRALLTLFFVLQGCAGFGASVHCFARFVLCRELRYLLAAAAFSTLGSGAALQAIADLSSAEPALHGFITTAAWTVAAVLLVGTVFSDSQLRPANRKEAFVQFALGLLAVLAFPIAASPYALDSTLFYTLCGRPSAALWRYLIEILAGLIALIMIVFALLGCYRRFRSQHDRLAGLMCYFLVPCAFGLVFRAASAVRFDAWWLEGKILLSAAWLVLVAAGAVETAFAHKEASSRLVELEDLHEVSWSLVGARTLSELLDIFMRTLVDKMGASIAALFLIDETGENLQVAGVCGDVPATTAVGKSYPVFSTDRRPGFHTGHTAEAFKSREVRIANDVFVDVELVGWRTIAVDDGCATSIPLVSGEEAIGVLDLYFSDRTRLTKQMLKLLAIVTAAAAPAIQHVRARESRIRVADDLERAA